MTARTLEMPAATGDVVTEWHARYCRENGHATHTIDGVTSPWCPRCGDNRPAVKSTGDPVRIDTVVEALVGATGGATIHVDGSNYTGHGLVVALPYGDNGDYLSDFVNWTENTRQRQAELIYSWVERVKHHVAGTRMVPRAFGVWTSDESLYLDVVELYPADRRDDAIRAGEARNQIAIWDAGRGIEIATGGDGH